MDPDLDGVGNVRSIRRVATSKPDTGNAIPDAVMTDTRDSAASGRISASAPEMSSKRQDRPRRRAQPFLPAAVESAPRPIVNEVIVLGYAPSAIEDYALISDCRSCALVGRNGSIDWLCWPRFDSPACFAALLGSDDNGRWLLAPAAGGGGRSSRTYLDDGMAVETVFETDAGTVAVIDFMAIDAEDPTLVRIVEGRRGRVAMQMELALRFGYGREVPWVTHGSGKDNIVAIAGPSLVSFHSPVALSGRRMRTIAAFEVADGDSLAFSMSWRASHLPPPGRVDADAARAKMSAFWRDWSSTFKWDGPYEREVRRSLLTLKAMIFAETGGIVAAATTSLPEQLGGPRNWDYRYCWLRDATLTLFALMRGGFYDEARAWRDWLHRSVAGDPGQIQIMYGLGGERQLQEWTVPWLSGYQGAAPVRIGNAASEQLQLDTYGEVVGALHQARMGSLKAPRHGWSLQRSIVEHLETVWSEPDEGMWEVRGGRKNFVTSKAFCWFALDRSIQDAERFHLPAPLERWKALRARVHREVCDKGFSTEKNSFKQSYEHDALDASLLLLPTIGFLPPDDPWILGTIAAVEHELLRDGFVLRYRTEEGSDGLPGGEGAFLACSFWLVDAYAMTGRLDEAERLFQRLLSLANDVGLLAEEYDPTAGRLVGNFPQAFSHLALISSAARLRDARRDQDTKPRG